MVNKKLPKHRLWRVARGLSTHIFSVRDSLPALLPSDMHEAVAELAMHVLQKHTSSDQLVSNTAQSMMKLRFLMDCSRCFQDVYDADDYCANGLEPTLGRAFVPPNKFHELTARAPTQQPSCTSYSSLFHAFTVGLGWDAGHVDLAALSPMICSIDLSMDPSANAEILGSQLQRNAACAQSQVHCARNGFNVDASVQTVADQGSRNLQHTCVPYGSRMFVAAFVHVSACTNIQDDIAKHTAHQLVPLVAFGCIDWKRSRAQETRICSTGASSGCSSNKSFMRKRVLHRDDDTRSDFKSHTPKVPR